MSIIHCLSLLTIIYFVKVRTGNKKLPSYTLSIHWGEEIPKKVWRIALYVYDSVFMAAISCSTCLGFELAHKQVFPSQKCI